MITEEIFTKYEALLLKFLEGGVGWGLGNSKWIEVFVSEELSIQTYLRKNPKYVAGVKHNALVLANIVVNPVNQGIGKRVLEILQRNNPFEIFVVENIQNQNFYTHLKKAGLQNMPLAPGEIFLQETQSLYKVKEPS
jgi:hypothetical protein